MTQTGSNLQIVILAAGKGVRMNSRVPKVLHRVCGWTLLKRSLFASLKLSPESVIVVVGYGRELVQKEAETLLAEGHFGSSRLDIVTQAEQLGTGHAAQMAVPRLSAENILIMPGDCPLITADVLARFVAEHNSVSSMLSVLSFEPGDGAGFGRIVRADDGRVIRIVEKKDCSPDELEIPEVNSSIYLVSRGLLLEALGALQPNNAQQEYYLTDIVRFAAEKGIRVEAVNVGKDPSVLGANDRAELSALELSRRAEIVRSLQLSGVTFEDPLNVVIEEDVQIGADTFIGAGTKLQEKTRIGSGVVIDGNSLISDSEIADGTHIKFSCVIESARVGASCDIGPFARLRPQSHLHEEVKIGNFVEIKNAELERGAKANHLTYLGDAFVGEQANVGAGTITCNYDGIAKYRTTIEEGAFVGSNTCLVAPVRVGAGAFIGAGSTITKDVPAGALAISREKQANVEGWAERRNAKKDKSRKA